MSLAQPKLNPLATIDQLASPPMSLEEKGGRRGRGGGEKGEGKRGRGKVGGEGRRTALQKGRKDHRCLLVRNFWKFGERWVMFQKILPNLHKRVNRLDEFQIWEGLGLGCFVPFWN